jgi:predicted GNAT superfamily acetyltransferase
MVDPRAAANWAMQETDAEARGIFVDMVVMNWVLNEATDSIDWANGIQDPEVREAALEGAFVALDAEAPAALDYWLESHPSHAARQIALSVRDSGAE